MEAKLGPSWRQVGSYKGSKWHAKVTSMLSLFFIEKCEFGSPQGDGGGLGKDPCGVMGFYNFSFKNAIFPLVFQGFAKSRRCARREEIT